MLTRAVGYARKFSPVSGISWTLLTLLANTPDVSLKLDQSAKNLIFFFLKGDCRAGEQIKDRGVTRLYRFLIEVERLSGTAGTADLGQVSVTALLLLL